MNIIKPTKLRIIMVSLSLFVLVGCQNNGIKETVDNNVDSNIENNLNEITDTDKTDIIENNSVDDTNENIDNNEKNEYEFEPTITDPEKSFEGIQLTTGYKAISNHNPLITQRFGADPFAMAYEDRVYVYMTNDSQQLTFDGNGKALENTYGKIKSLNLISSNDMVNWTDHGTINVGKPNGATWWANNSWAPSAAYKEIDGKDQFFIYFANSAGGIGVLRADSPVGPFKDPIGKPLISKETENCANVLWLFDPAVLVDDDGRAYIYFGGGVPDGKEEMPNTARMVELGADMISIVGTPAVIEAPYIFEDSGINKIGDTYYYSYCSNWSSRDNAVGPYVPGTAEIIYMTSKNPLGPWEYQGSILQNPGKFFGSWGNNHHSMVQFKDKWYMVYHTQYLQDTMKIKGGYRSTHVDEVTINTDGSINDILATKTGVEQIANLDPYKVNEAEAFAWNGGIVTMKINDISPNYGEVNNALTELTTGDWIGISNVDFGSTAPTKFTAKVYSEVEGNVIRISADSQDGEVLGYLEVPNTKDIGEYVDISVDIKGFSGVHHLFFTFCGDGFQFDHWSFQ